MQGRCCRMQGRLDMLAQLLCILELIIVQTRHLTSPRHNGYVKHGELLDHVSCMSNGGHHKHCACQHIWHRSCFISRGAAEALAHADASPVAMHRALKMTEDYGACCAQVVHLHCITHVINDAHRCSNGAESLDEISLSWQLKIVRLSLPHVASSKSTMSAGIELFTRSFLYVTLQ